MNKLYIDKSWFKTLFPEGFAYPSSTIISGKGGSGKPLVELAFVAEWIRSGKSVIGMPLQYPSAEFVHAALSDLFNMQYNDYASQLAYLHFNPDAQQADRIKKYNIETNLLEEKQWHNAIEMAKSDLNTKDEDIMLFGAAFNLLLFAPRYKQAILDRVNDMLKDSAPCTVMISVSTSAMREDIRRWENTADNLLYTRMDDNHQLWLRTERMKHDEFSNGEISLPISKKEIDSMKDIALHSRNKIIPKLKNIT
ncbi:MAG: hypothetical protein ACP5DZ_02475 [Bacteroidales bacterium]